MALPFLTLLFASAATYAALLEHSLGSETVLADYISGDAPGLRDASISTSTGGKAICISGLIDVTVSATQPVLGISEPANNTELVALVTDVVQPTSNLSQTVVQGMAEVNGTYEIFSQLCFPKAATALNTSSTQFLIHGGGYDSRYWDPAPGYSYVDTAASHGHVTFNYDRLGVGLSSQPSDPINIPQKPLQIEIAHTLIQQLRAGALLNLTFPSITGVGHSFGSNQLYTLVSQYPSDLDAAIFTGFSKVATGQGTSVVGLNAGLANQVDPTRWRALPNGYIASRDASGGQFFFLRWPNFSAELADVSERIKQPISLGELFGFGGTLEPTNFTGPVAVVNGQNDYPICAGNCEVPVNSARELVEFGFPQTAKGEEGRGWHVVEGSGHGINFHYGAEGAYEWIMGFLERDGF
jgi:pimeloyl-ACP methyl ester carboxylesterase